MKSTSYIPAGLRRPLLAALLPLFSLICPLATVNATTYYFSTSGDDANDGTDPSTPKKNLSVASSLALPGNTLLFKRGDAWYTPFNSFDLQNKAGTDPQPIVIDAYGSAGAKPIIAGLQLLDDAGWTNVPGTNTWSHPVTGFSDAWRLYVGGVSKYKVNTSNSAANETNVDQPYKWYIKPVVAGQSGIVYVNTGSATVAPKSVEVHPVGAVSTILMRNTSHMSVRNLDIRGGSQYNVVYVEAPSSYLEFDGNTIQEANGSGLLMSNLASGVSDYVSNVTITNNIVDKVWNTYENDPNIILSGDGIFILHAVDTGVIRGNQVRNWGHVGITLSSYRAGFHGVHNFVVEENSVSAGASGYMHAFDVDGFEGLTTNNIVRRNLLYDYTSTCHAQGNNNQYYSNIFVGVTLTTQPKEDQQPWGLDMLPWKYTDGNWMAAHDNYVVNNTIVATQQYPIIMGDDATSTSVVTNNVVANNVIYNYGVSGSGQLGLAVLPTVRGNIPVQNNDFWAFSSTAAVARYTNGSVSGNYTAVQLNTTFPQLCSGNVQADPSFANAALRDFRLTSNSPDSVKSVGQDMTATLGAGFVDYRGNPWSPGSPSMGAFQYVAGEDVSQPLSMPPHITAQPANQTVNVGNSATLTVTAIGSPTLSYQWRKGSVPIAGATNSSYTISSTSTDDAGSYDVVITNSLGLATSAMATLTVNPPGYVQEVNLSQGKAVTYSTIRSGESSGTPPSYLTDGDTSLTHLVAVGNANQLVYVTIDLGQTSTIQRLKMWHYWGDGRTYHDVIVQLSSTANFSSDVTTVFNNDANNSAGFGIGPDAEYKETSAGKELVLPSAISARYARFFIGGNTVNGFNHYVELQVFGYVTAAPSFTTQPASQTATVGDGVTFSVTAAGVPTPYYQWRKDGAPIAGAVSPVYTISSVVTADAGNYDVVLTSSSGTATSNIATLTVNPAAAGVDLHDLTQIYDGNPHAATVSTTPVGIAYSVTYNGTASVPINAGSYAVAVTVTDANYTGSASGTLVITPAAAQVKLANLNATYDGAPQPASVTTDPAGVGVTVTYDGAADAPVNAGSYGVIATVSDSNYTGSASGTLTIAPASASIGLDGLLQTYDGTPRLVTTTTIPADLPVSLTYNGSSTPPVNPGVYTIEARVTDPNYSGSANDALTVTITALVRHAPVLNGGLDGSMQVASAENVTLNSSAWVAGDLLLPGSPLVKLNGSPSYAGTVDGAGAVDPSSYTVTLNGASVLRHVVRRTDALTFPVVTAPPAPAGTRDVVLNAPNQSAGDFATVRNLTLNSHAGDVAVPPGTYGAFTANGSSRLILGVANATEPAVYNLQGLALNGSSSLVLVGPVVLNLAHGGSLNSSANASGSPAWLALNITDGGLTLNGAEFAGYVVAPAGTVTLNGGATLAGEIVADRLVINSNSTLAEPAD